MGMDFTIHLSFWVYFPLFGGQKNTWRNVKWNQRELKSPSKTCIDLVLEISLASESTVFLLTLVSVSDIDDSGFYLKTVVSKFPVHWFIVLTSLLWLDSNVLFRMQPLTWLIANWNCLSLFTAAALYDVVWRCCMFNVLLFKKREKDL